MASETVAPLSSLPCSSLDKPVKVSAAAETVDHSRRRLLGVGLGLVAATAAGGLLKPAEALAAIGGPRKLSLKNMNTGESFTSVYWRDGRYVPDALQKLNILLRDHRANEVHRIDPQLFDLLAAISHKMDIAGTQIQIVSAYRAPRTNAQRASESRGVARNSYHIQGMALDIRLPGRDLRGIYNTAVAMGEGGVGFYRRSGFVHVDTGPVRTWGAKGRA
ncbi:DUF882 domain-containing protein [Zavarzinia compransoris]|uniref:DUF882 domain-containing protein n=1 Tax=Zavarzinia compransoris TaxID=1264899 RepID=UPI001AAE17F7|nr:DUF882 domain-containing protein [Zavarzinia compransoris]